ncbi:MAG TPA: helix-turn-helix transcriptional regulator [Dehalococcoidia bacterium]|nr:helix-turn-helix transcriptional regulator [Dehalococcoidia bacterium]
MARGRPPYPDVLTPRQWEVLELVREGRSNGEIGRELGISTDGAKFHVSEILTKLGVSTRREAAEWEGTPAGQERVEHEAGTPTACVASIAEYRLRRARSVRHATGGPARSPWSIFQLPVLVMGTDDLAEAA